MGIVAVWGPPNSGKTTLTIDLAHALTRYGRSVCLISPESYGELGARLGMNIPPERSLLNISKGEGALEQSALRLSELLFLLSAGSVQDAFGEEPGSAAARRLLERAEASFDLVLTDCPAAMDNAVSAWALKLAKRVVLLSGCRSASGTWYASCGRAMENLGGKAVPVCLEVSPAMDYPSLLKLENMTPAVWVPHYPNAEEAQGEKKTLYESGGRLGRAYTESIDALCAILLEEGGEEA